VGKSDTLQPKSSLNPLCFSPSCTATTRPSPQVSSTPSPPSRPKTKTYPFYPAGRLDLQIRGLSHRPLWLDGVAGLLSSVEEGPLVHSYTEGFIIRELFIGRHADESCYRLSSGRPRSLEVNGVKACDVLLCCYITFIETSLAQSSQLIQILTPSATCAFQRSFTTYGHIPVVSPYQTPSLSGHLHSE